jgi:hypothetical protein
MHVPQWIFSTGAIVFSDMAPVRALAEDQWRVAEWLATQKYCKTEDVAAFVARIGAQQWLPMGRGRMRGSSQGRPLGGAPVYARQRLPLGRPHRRLCSNQRPQRLPIPSAYLRDKPPTHKRDILFIFSVFENQCTMAITPENENKTESPKPAGMRPPLNNLIAKKTIICRSEPPLRKPRGSQAGLRWRR